MFGRAGVEITDSDSLTVTVIDPLISLVKTASVTTINAGDPVIYTIVAANGGNWAAAARALGDDAGARSAQARADSLR